MNINKLRQQTTTKIINNTDINEKNEKMLLIVVKMNVQRLMKFAAVQV